LQATVSAPRQDTAQTCDRRGNAGSTDLIIRTDGKDLVFIRQPDHAAAAADLMRAWTTDGLPRNPRRDSILSAIHAHDNGWIEEDDDTIVSDEGTPVDFIAVPFEVKQRVWPRCVDRLGAQWPYVAALVAQHSLTIFQDSRAKPEWQPYFEEMTARRDALLSRCAAQTAAAIDEDYRFVRMADLMSLVFCNAWVEPLEYRGRRVLLTGTALTVTPDPFGGARVELRIPARRAPRRAYASAADLRAEIAAAQPEILEGTAVGG
jgi:hypothetical protein